MRVQKKEMRKPETQLFAEGEIWYYRNPFVRKADYTDAQKNDDFLSNRPVLIISNTNGPSNHYVTVCEITHSTNQAGFICNVSVDDESIIMPHQIHTVKTCYLSYRVTALTKEAMSEVKKAVAYHMGMSDEVPPYYVYNEYGEDRFATKTVHPYSLQSEKSTDSQPSADDLESIKILNEILEEMPKETDFTDIDFTLYNLDYGKVADSLSLEELMAYNTDTRRGYIQKRFGVSYYKANGIMLAILNKQRQLLELLKIKKKSGVDMSELEIDAFYAFSRHINNNSIL